MKKLNFPPINLRRRLKNFKCFQMVLI